MDFENVSNQLPNYLLPTEKVKLFSEIKKFKDSRSNTNIYLEKDIFSGEILQGDSWGAIKYIDPESGKSKSIKGVILSNSCDSSADNKRFQPLKISFSPLIDLAKYINLIEKKFDSKKAQEVERKIREHDFTHIMYFPPSKKLKNETIALLDNIVSLPRDNISNANSGKIHCLSQFGFYLFIIKLSIHFTRVNESLSRFD